MSELRFVSPEEALEGADTWVFAGTVERLASPAVVERIPERLRPAWARLLEHQRPGDGGATSELWDAERRIVAVSLPTGCSRHNSEAQPHALTRGLRAALGGGRRIAVLPVLAEPEHELAVVAALARAVPLYDLKSKGKGEGGLQELRIAPLGAAGASPVSPWVQAAAHGVRRAARLTDMPASELHTDAYLEEVRGLAAELGCGLEILRGEELQQAGYGGLWGVGRTAVHPPALAILSHRPPGATRRVCWVGKGIVYDTGGLSIKSKEHMPGMKVDMGGSAAVFAAFEAAVRAGVDVELHALLCLAENSVGPDSVRPDDILRLYSGKTVEVNNTDAEGRLVLGDGVAHAVAHLAPDQVIDLATLTGAQLIATGKRHAAVVSNDEGLERQAVEAGRRSGDLVHPLPYCPEFYRAEFKSSVADMKNSVKDRANAQASCAAQFVAEHLGDWKGAWLHVDLAGPAVDGERATGFGVALLLQLLRAS